MRRCLKKAFGALRPRLDSMQDMILFLLVSALMQAQPAHKFDLTIDNIMRGPGLIGYEPIDVRWSGDSQRIYFRWKQASDPMRTPRDTYVVNRDGSGLRKLAENESKLAPPVDGVRTRDRKRAVYALDGDIYVYDYSSDKARPLTQTTEVETHPHFSRDETRVAFTRAQNLYTISLQNGALEQATNIAPSPAEPKLTEEQEFLKKQERELLATVGDRAKTREENQAKKKLENPRIAFDLKPEHTLVSLDLCPDLTCVVAVISEGAKGAKRESVPAYVTESSFTEEIPGRTNVGDLQDRQRIVLLNTATGAVTWVDGPVKDREVEMQAPVWSDDGRKAVFLARAMDNKDRWILALDATSGKTRVLFNEHNDAWVGGPGEYTLAWLRNSSEIFFESERDGFSHLYSVDIDGGETTQLTSGKFEVLDAALSNDGSRFYLTTNEGSPYEQHLYSMKVEGGERTRISKAAGKHQVVLSPDEKSGAGEVVNSLAAKPISPA